MKRNAYFVLTIVGLLALLVAGITSSAQNWKTNELKLRQADERDIQAPISTPISTPTTYESPAELLSERYEASNVLQLDYGDGEKQAGLIAGVRDFRPMGPLSFAIKGEAIYILDEVNDRAKAFNRAGELIRSLEVSQGSTDIAVDSNDRLYVLDRKVNSIAEYDLGSSIASRYNVKQPIDGLSGEATDGVGVKMHDSNSYSLQQSGGNLSWQASPEPYTCLKVGDHSGRVTNNSTGNSFSVSTENFFGSISYLGTDREQNIYVVVEELLPGDTIQVQKEVRKYTPTGKQIAEIPVNINYAAHPEKELILDEDGSVYHLLPLKDHVVVEKWSRKY